MNRRQLLSTLLISAAVILPLLSARACGPDFVPDVFVRREFPDRPAEFAQGHLGVLLPGYFDANLIAAWRYLNAGTLTPAEQTVYLRHIYYAASQSLSAVESEAPFKAPADEPAAHGLNDWQNARAGFIKADAKVAADREVRVTANDFTYTASFVNCPDDAFRIAALTLQARAKSYPSPAAINEWISAQDQVFSNCSQTAVAIPSELASSAPALLRADRSYQIAAANFYALNYDDARAGFDAIARDSSSPWHEIAPYLAARAAVRASTVPANSNDPAATADRSKLIEAQHLLDPLLKTDYPYHHAAQQLLDFILCRTDPARRFREASVVLTGPASTSGDEYDHQMTDFIFLRTYGKAPGEDTDPGELYDWITTIRSQATEQQFLEYREDSSGKIAAARQQAAAAAHQHALKRWRASHSLPWLIASLIGAQQSDSEASALLEAAASVPQTSPAHETVTYYRAQLLIRLDQSGKARQLLDPMLTRLREQHASQSTINGFTGLRMQAAANLTEFLSNAPRTLVDAESQSHFNLAACIDDQKNGRDTGLCVHQLPTVDFDSDAASFFNTRAPLSTWVTAANSASLPADQRRAIAISGWVRAILLKDDATAAQLQPLLPEPIRSSAKSAGALTPVLTILRYPGLRWYLDQGTQRSLAFGRVDSYRDNWWCGAEGPEWFGDPSNGFRDSPAASFMTACERAEATAQYKTLSQMKDAPTALGEFVLAYAAAHPSDPALPEALHYTVRATRYGCIPYNPNPPPIGSPESRKPNISKQAFEILHRRYPNSEWTRKTPYYF